jgi:CPA2 family monovalent cation:H+ antiporter-2
LPLLVVSVFKLRELADALAARADENRPPGTKASPAARGVVTGTVWTAGVAGMGLWLVALSAAILPPWPVLVILLLLVAAVAYTLWRGLIRVYQRASDRLQAALSEPTGATGFVPLAVPALLAEAKLETVEVGEKSAANGRLIRELELRTRTGASAVGVERAGENIINPGPDVELRSGDKVLLLGRPSQLEAARQLLRE